MGPVSLVHAHVRLLLGALVPSFASTPHARALADDVSAHITAPFSSAQRHYQTAHALLDRYRQNAFPLNDDWAQLEHVLDTLAHASLVDEILRHLQLFSRFVPEQPESRVESPLTERSFPLAALADDPVIASLHFTLLGQDTKHFTFLRDLTRIEFSLHHDSASSQMLAEILELALLYKSLHAFVHAAKGTSASPIKVAFTRYVESYLNDYAAFVDTVSVRLSPDLLSLADLLVDQTRSMRLLGYLQTQLAKLDGFHFLLELHRLTQFGDLAVADLTQSIYTQVLAPYFEYLEHWLIKGELIDENGDFFISFDAEKSHINDIIKFDAQKVPSFLGLNEGVCRKALQVGKTLVFLEKYCDELTWVSLFANKYSEIVFHDHPGMLAFRNNEIQRLIENQFDEVISYLTGVVQSKYNIYLHLLNLKRIMLMESSDLIENIHEKGSGVFGEAAAFLTSGRLLELLVDSLSSSSLKNLPTMYQNRIDTALLASSHGKLGWDVFTLEYALAELPVDTLLNYNDQTTQYMRIFNFLWGLRHTHFVLRQSYLEVRALHKSELKSMREKLTTIRDMLTRTQFLWCLKAVKAIDLFRNRLNVLVMALLKYVSLDLIEEKFNTKVVQGLYLSLSSLPSSPLARSSTMPFLNAGFEAILRQKLGLQSSNNHTVPSGNMKMCTIDEIALIHLGFLRSVTDCKLFREDAAGQYSEEPFVHQISRFMSVAREFVQESNEFCSTVSNFVSVISLEARNSTDYAFGDDIDMLWHRMKAILRKIKQQLLHDQFEPALKIFVKDLKAESDLKEFGRGL